MLSFSSFISESKSAPLYHGTTFDAVISILRAGKIKPSANGYLSVSRNLRYASEWGGEAYFVLNQMTISHNQKITPTDWTQGGGAVKDIKSHDGGLGHANAFDIIDRRTEAEEAIKGAVDLKHVVELVVNSKGPYGSLIGAITDEEKEMEAELLTNPDLAPFFKGMLYSDRVKDQKKFADLVKKKRIKLTVRQF